MQGTGNVGGTQAERSREQLNRQRHLLACQRDFTSKVKRLDASRGELPHPRVQSFSAAQLPGLVKVQRLLQYADRLGGDHFRLRPQLSG
jgi:hypothetical protein